MLFSKFIEYSEFIIYNLIRSIRKQQIFDESKNRQKLWASFMRSKTVEIHWMENFFFQKKKRKILAKRMEDLKILIDMRNK